MFGKKSKKEKKPVKGGKKNVGKTVSGNPELYIKRGAEYIPVQIKTHQDKNGGHYHVVLETFDEKHVSVGLTTKPKKGKGAKNYRLEKSPLDDGKTSYMRRQGTVASKGEYKNPRKGSMTPKDYNRAKEYGDRAKQKHLQEKKDKKK